MGVKAVHHVALFGGGHLGRYLLERWSVPGAIRIAGVWNDPSEFPGDQLSDEIPKLANWADVSRLANVETVILDLPRDKANAAARAVLGLGLPVIAAIPPVSTPEEAVTLWSLARQQGATIGIHPLVDELADWRMAGVSAKSHSDDPPRLIRYEHWGTVALSHEQREWLLWRSLSQALALAGGAAVSILAQPIQLGGLAIQMEFATGAIAQLTFHPDATVRRIPRWLIDAQGWGYDDGRIWERAADGELSDRQASAEPAIPLEEWIVARAAHRPTPLTEVLRQLAVEDALRRSLRSGKLEKVEAVASIEKRSEIDVVETSGA